VGAVHTGSSDPDQHLALERRRRLRFHRLQHFRPAVACDGNGNHAAHLQTGAPRSNRILHRLSLSRRHTELNRPISSPLSSCTGPLVSAMLPESITSTMSGSHEKGAVEP